MSQDAPVLDLSRYDNSRLRIAIIASRFNDDLVGGMLERTVKNLVLLGVPEANLKVDRVPGSAELAYASQSRARSGNYDVVIALGVLIAGETQHHDIISRTVSLGLQQVSLAESIPVLNGVISAETLEQARDRTIGELNRGKEFAEAAIEMAHWR
jgi:6,7-dimethyl-8-ribityllumazine synthase